MAKDYGAYSIGRNDFELGPTVGEAFERSKPHIESYTVSTEADEEKLSYRIKASFSFDTPLGYFIPFLEGGGTVTFTRDGKTKRIVLETVTDGSKRS